MAALHGGALRLVLISRGSVQQNLAKLKGPVTLPILLQPDFEVAEAYDCSSTPAAVLVSADGVIQSLLAVGAPAIEQLIASAVDVNPTSVPPRQRPLKPPLRLSIAETTKTNQPRTIRRAAPPCDEATARARRPSGQRTDRTACYADHTT